jgi:hypothetical protein
MKQKLFIAWSCVHVLFIILVNLLGSYKSYHEFFNKPQDSRPVSFLVGLFNKVPFNYYGRYTGAETGYGFFGINVRSNGLLLGECDGKKLIPVFASYETSLRFFTMANAVTDGYLSEAEGRIPDSLRQSMNIKQAYDNLVLKNIAFTLYTKYGCSDSSATLSYNLLNYPSMAALQKGYPPKYQLVKMVTLHIGIH